MNKRGPSVEPWVTPHEIGMAINFFSLISTSVFYLLDMSRTIR